jgi:hypothetical protein
MNDRSVFVCRKSILNGAAGWVASNLLAGLMVLCSVSQAFSGLSCKPLLTIKDVRFSEVQSLRRTWSKVPLSLRVWMATLLVDASRCATSSGRFEIDFVGLGETGPYFQFTEQFTWNPGQTEVSVDMSADEAILDYRVGFIAPCVCREMPF